MSNQITIEIPDGKKAEWVDGVLTLVDEAPKNVMERIKTLDDAIEELGEDDDFVQEYRDVQDQMTTPDLLAYLKLRIITAALNEGWKPQFTEVECRYFPWFYIYTKDELDKMSEEARSHVVVRPPNHTATRGGLVFAHANYASSYSNSFNGSRLAFKNEELAEYAGKQFIEIWADYLCA